MEKKKEVTKVEETKVVKKDLKGKGWVAEEIVAMGLDVAEYDAVMALPTEERFQFVAKKVSEIEEMDVKAARLKQGYYMLALLTAPRYDHDFSKESELEKQLTFRAFVKRPDCPWPQTTAWEILKVAEQDLAFKDMGVDTSHMSFSHLKILVRVKIKAVKVRFVESLRENPQSVADFEAEVKKYLNPGPDYEKTEVTGFFAAIKQLQSKYTSEVVEQLGKLYPNQVAFYLQPGSAISNETAVETMKNLAQSLKAVVKTWDIVLENISEEESAMREAVDRVRVARSDRLIHVEAATS